MHTSLPPSIWWLLRLNLCHTSERSDQQNLPSRGIRRRHSISTEVKVLCNYRIFASALSNRTASHTHVDGVQHCDRLLFSVEEPWISLPVAMVQKGSKGSAVGHSFQSKKAKIRLTRQLHAPDSSIQSRFPFFYFHPNLVVCC